MSFCFVDVEHFSDGNINGNCVEVKVSYYDEGEGKFTLNYDGRDKVEAHPDIVRLTNSEMWKTKESLSLSVYYKAGIRQFPRIFCGLIEKKKFSFFDFM